MSRNILTYIIALAFVVSCGNKESMLYTVRGNAGEKNGRILVFGLDDRFDRIDSVRTDEKGQFSYTIETATTIPVEMIMPDNKKIMLYAEPGITARVSYDDIIRHDWVVDGGMEQAFRDSIFSMLESCKNERERNDSIESFIKQYPVSDINIEIFRKYLIEKPVPDNHQIKSLISKLGGTLQDHKYFTNISNLIEKRNSNTLHKLFPSFRYTTADSCKEVTLNTFEKKYLLVTFWASWDQASLDKMKRLREMDDSIKSNSFAILNIALDHDTAQWKMAVEKDSIAGYNVCETCAWSSDISNRFNIKSLPYTILVSPYQRIAKFGIEIGKDWKMVDSLAAKYDKESAEREREKKERERKEKAREKQKKEEQERNEPDEPDTDNGVIEKSKEEQELPVNKEAEEKRRKKEALRNRIINKKQQKLKELEEKENADKEEEHKN